MQETTRHIINTQLLDVQYYGSEQHALDFQRRLVDCCKSGLIPGLELRFDRLAGDDKHLAIDYLEVEVACNGNALSEDALANMLADAVTSRLEKVIANQAKETAINGVSSVTPPQHVVDILVFYLASGRLPWYVFLSPGEKLESFLIQQCIDLEIPSTHMTRLEKLLENTTAQKRLTKTFSPAYVLHIIKQLPLCKNIRVQEAMASDQLFQLIHHALVRKLPGADPQKISSRQPLAANGQSKTRARQTALPLPIPGMVASNDSAREKMRPGEINGEGEYIGNAGLVLLHPFLPQLFETLQLYRDNHLTDPGTALQVLHFIATGQVVPVEYELILPKVLCNIPINDFVDTEASLHEDQCLETERMIRAAVHHWSALRNTSIDGLRESFLQRPGRLSFNAGTGWSLHVEVKTFDILLNHLPWGFGRIQLPWMNDMLHVQWDYQQLS